MCKDFTLFSDCELCQHIDSQYAFMELEYRYLWLVRKKANDILCGKISDRDDFIQEGLLGLYYAAKSYDPQKGTSFKTYASICIHNRMNNELKRSMRLTNYLSDSQIDEVEQLAPSPQEEFELREDFEAVLNQIHISLSEFEKKILALYLSGSTRSEIPSKYGISIKAYDNAVQRFRNKLKTHRF